MKKLKPLLTVFVICLSFSAFAQAEKALPPPPPERVAPPPPPPPLPKHLKAVKKQLEKSIQGVDAPKPPVNPEVPLPPPPPPPQLMNTIIKKKYLKL